MPSKRTWIWRQPHWPHLTYDRGAVVGTLGEAFARYGALDAQARALGLVAASPIAIDVAADEVVATAAIEGEQLAIDAVRSSVRRRLGLEGLKNAMAKRYRDMDGLVEVLTDATQGHGQPLDADRLCRWQSALFPGGTAGIRRIAVGRYRDHADAMQIVSGPPDAEVVHYVAPASADVPAEMAKFLQWFADTTPVLRGIEPPVPAHGRQFVDPFSRAAIAHLWFEAIHPFEDGNGRIGRAIVDLAVAQYLRQPVRLYSLSRQLLGAREDYYDRLNAAQRGGLDVTEWVDWFVRQCARAYEAGSAVIELTIAKRRFWDDRHGNELLNERQRKVVQKLLDAGDGGFEGGMDASKYAKLTDKSKPTATRDLSDLVTKGFLWTHGVGKAVRYYVAVPGWTHGLPSGSAAPQGAEGAGQRDGD